MKLKKWLYGLGGVAVVATPAIAVVGCSCSCSSKPSSSSQVFSTYSYEDSTKTGRYLIEGVLYHSIKREIDTLTPALRDQINAFFFGKNSAMMHVVDEIQSNINTELAQLNQPSTVAPAEVKIEHIEGKSIELIVKFGAQSIVTDEKARALVVDVIKHVEVTDSSVVGDEKLARETIWGMISSAIQISQ